tara:strand:+ start:227 stop:469 length:243 start_codon:yes stop_codon:yes gene_type:complete
MTKELNHKLIRTEIVQDSTTGENHVINKWKGHFGGFFFAVHLWVDEKEKEDEDFDKGELSMPFFQNRKRALQEINWSAEG